MNTSIFTLAAFLCAAGIQAQTTPKTTTSSTSTATSEMKGHHECLMADEATWKSFGLSADQITKVKAVQEKCKADKMGDMNKDNSAMSKYDQEVKGILTSEQYTSWQKWCSAQHGDMKKDNMTPDKK